MKNRYINTVKFIILITIAFFSFSIAYGQKINQFKTNDFELVYFGKRYSFLVPYVASAYENANRFHEKIWNYKNPHTNIVLNDFSDYGHGGAIAMPENQVFIGIEPYNFSFSIIPSYERLQWLFNHELTHVTMGDKPNKTDESWRKVFFGKIRHTEKAPITALWSYLTVPRWFAPRWYHEGIACFMETWMSGGLGRAMGNYDEMYFRSIVSEKKPIYSVVGLETEGTTIDFQVGANSYLYGSRFVTYLANNYGLNKLINFYSRTDDSRPFYASQFKKTYNETIRKEWNKWIDFEYEFQNKNIDQIKQFPLSSFKNITKEPLGNVSRLFYNDSTQKIYVAINHPGKISQVAEIDKSTGSVRKICILDSPQLYYSTFLTYNKDDNKLYITEQNQNYRNLVEVDITSGKKKVLIDFTRAGDLAFNNKDKSIWAIKHDNGYAILVKIPEPYNKVIPMYTAEFGKALFDIDISHDGRFLSSSFSGVKGEQSIIMFNIDNLENGKKEYTTIKELEDNTLTQFRFSNNDKFLIGTSYYTGVSNVWRINIENGNFELLSNTETGFFSPVQINNDSLVVLKFYRDGMQPGVIPVEVINDANSIKYLGNLVHKRNPEIEEWALNPASKLNIDSLKQFEGNYNILKEMKLANAYPEIVGFKKTVALGYHINLRDPIGLSDLDLFIGCSPWSNYDDKQKIHAHLDWKYKLWRFNASYNKTNFYDLFGPTMRSRAGYSAGISYDKTNSLKSPLKFNYNFSLSTFGGLEVLPQYQNVSVDSLIKSFQYADASYEISKIRKTLGGVDYEKGYNWKISASTYYAGGKLFPNILSEQSIGFVIPIMRNTSFWIRNSIGQAFGDENSSMSKFYFGGFRNNYIDWQESEQYRKTNAFPGVRIDAIPARNFIKTMGELNLRPLRLANVGATWIYPTYIKTSLFGTHLLTDFYKTNETRNIFNAGLQIDMQVVMFSYFKTTWSAGYALTFENKIPGQSTDISGQLMLSLKLLGN